MSLLADRTQLCAMIRLLSGLLLCLWHTAFARTRWQSDSVFNVKS